LPTWPVDVPLPRLDSSLLDVQACYSRRCLTVNQEIKSMDKRRFALCGFMRLHAPCNVFDDGTAFGRAKK
jgi:hypothetical protein